MRTEFSDMFLWDDKDEMHIGHISHGQSAAIVAYYLAKATQRIIIGKVNKYVLHLSDGLGVHNIQIAFQYQERD